MSLKGCGRKRSWPNFRILSVHLPEGTEEKKEKLRIVVLRAEIRTWNLPNKKQVCYPHVLDVW
jgi:hypothetical protein